MGKFIDITGQKFHRLEVIRVHRRSQNGTDTLWWCKCKCGKELAVRSYCLRKNRTRSCGCYQPEAAARSNTTHGHTKDGQVSAAYSSWAAMIDRCTNPNNPQYHNYGERGIAVYQEWLESFDAFIQHIGPIPQDGQRYTLDRIDNTKNYEPGNVRWADSITQANNKRNNVKLTAFGETLTLPQWSRRTGIPIRTMRNRLLAKWDHEKIVTQKPRYRDAPSDVNKSFTWCG